MATARISDLVSQPGSSPSVERWAELCARLVALPARAPSDTLCRQLDEGLASWPDRLRIAPATWTRAAAAEQTPPFFSLVRTVNLGDLGEGAPLAEAVAALLAQPAMAAVRHLVADGLRLGEGGLRLLASSPCASGLRSLSLARAGLDPTDVFTLCGASSLGGLVSLELRGNSVGLDGAKALAASTVLVNLRRLGLARTRLGIRGAAFLTKSEALSRLVEIDLAENGLTDANLELLVLSPFLAELAVLRLSGNHVSRRGALALAGSPGSARFHGLDLRDNEIDAEGVRALLASPHLARLALLDIRGNPGAREAPGEVEGVVRRAEPASEPPALAEIAACPTPREASRELRYLFVKGRPARWSAAVEAGLPLEPPFHEATVGAWPWGEQPLPDGRWIAPDGSRGILGGRRGELVVCDLPSRSVVKRLGPIEDWVRAVAATLDGRWAVSAGGGGFTERRTPIVRSQAYWDAWNEARDGEYWPPPDDCSVERIEGPRDYRLWVWDLAASTCVRRIGGHTAPVIGASLSAEGAIAVSLDLAGNVRCFSVGDGLELGCWALKGATHVALDGRARFALLGTTAGAIHRLDLETGALAELVSRGTGGDPVRSLALSADGRHAAWSTSSAVRLWDAERGRLRGYLSRQEIELYQLAPTEPGLRLVVSAQGAIASWDLALNDG